MYKIRIRLSDTSPLIQCKTNFVIIRCATEEDAQRTMQQIRGLNTAAVTDQKEADKGFSELVPPVPPTVTKG